MDPQLLNYYERELQYMREMGSEFASEFPKIAGRLGLDSVETSDPYVERLLEGFAFLSARVHLRIDAEYPRFTQSLLSIVYPQYLAPMPSVAMVQFEPKKTAALEEGFEIERHTMMRSGLSSKGQAACQYRSCQSTVLWPVQIASAEYFSNIGAYAEFSSNGNKVKAGVRIRLSTSNGQPFNSMSLDDLTIHLGGQFGQAMRLYEQIFGNLCGVVVQSADSANQWDHNLGLGSIHQTGFENNESLLPGDDRTFSGYRLLREYFLFPRRFMFFAARGLNVALSRCVAAEVDFILLFDRYDQELENRVTEEDFKLHCAPAINLFPKRIDRLNIAYTQSEHHVVPDRTRPIDFEVYSIESMAGYGSGVDKKRDFSPFYQQQDTGHREVDAAFYTVRRERRVLSSKQKTRGARSTYIGSEIFVSLVDTAEKPLPHDLKQLEMKALCTNRDLPLQMPVGKGNTDFTLDSGAPIASTRCLGSPSRPKPSLAHSEGEIAWRLINQLSLNYMSLTGGDKLGDPSSLRSLLTLYADKNDASQIKQIEGITHIYSEQVTRRLPMAGPIAFGRGLRIEVTFDESAFVGSGIFLMGAVLDRFFARYVSINSFSETVIKSEDRGEVMVWPVRVGQRLTI